MEEKEQMTEEEQWPQAGLKKLKTIRSNSHFKAHHSNIFFHWSHFSPALPGGWFLSYLSWLY